MFSKLPALKQQANLLIEMLARHVCSFSGLDPDATYDMPGDDGPEKMPNWSRYSDNIEIALYQLFEMPDTEVRAYRKVFRTITEIENEIMAGLEDADEARAAN